MHEAIDIVNRIADMAGTLRQSEQKIARAILGDLPFAVSASIGELAQRADVSEASISRFAKTIGCQDVRELKIQLAKASVVGQRFLTDGGEVPASLTETIIEDIHRILELNRPLINEATIDKVVDRLHAARMIYAMGVGGSSTIAAQELQFRLVRLGMPIAVYSDAVMQRVVAATLDRRDVLVLFSATGQTPEIVDAAQLGREYGACVVSVTAMGSSLAAHTDILLPITFRDVAFIYQPTTVRYALLLMIDVVATKLALARKSAAKDKLRRLKYALINYRGGEDRQPLGD